MRVLCSLSLYHKNDYILSIFWIRIQNFTISLDDILHFMFPIRRILERLQLFQESYFDTTESFSVLFICLPVCVCEALIIIISSFMSKEVYIQLLSELYKS